MTKYLFPLFIFLASASNALHAETADYKLEVQDFSELKVTDNINVVYHCSIDSAGWVYFTCDPEVSSKLLFSNDKACLHIQVAADEVSLDKLPVVHVYSSALQKVENSSDSTTHILNNVTVPSFKCKVIGNGYIIIDNIDANTVSASVATGKGHIVISEGKAKKANYTNVGTGTIEAGALKARNVKVSHWGTNDVDCSASESLTIYGTGSGKIYYSGNPEKVSNRSMGIKAFPVETKQK